MVKPGMALYWIERTVSMTGAARKLLMVGTVSATVNPYLGRTDRAKVPDLYGGEIDKSDKILRPAYITFRMLKTR